MKPEEGAMASAQIGVLEKDSKSGWYLEDEATFRRWKEIPSKKQHSKGKKTEIIL